MANKYSLKAVAVGAVMVTPVAAYALTVDVSFTGGSGNTVTVALDFAASTAVHEMPTAVSIVSAPVGNNVHFSGTRVFEGGFGFNLNNSVITGVSFAATKQIGGQSYLLRLNAGGTFNEYYDNVGANFRTANNSGIQGLNGLSSAVPEPASIALLGAGLAGISAFRRRRATR
jgi:hypothetical protein